MIRIKFLIPLTLLAISILSVSSCGGKSVPLLNDYPRLFEEDTMIIRNGAQYVYTNAEMIAAKLEQLTGNAVIIKNDDEVSEDDKKAYNLILVEVPTANSVLSQVYGMTNATEVTADYPGECKAIIEILPNPWNKNKVLLTVTSYYDKWGMEAATMMLTNDSKIEELNGNLMIVASAYTRTRTMPSGYVDIWVSPGDIIAHVGEDVVISCYVSPQISTHVDLTSFEIAFLDSNESLIRKQTMSPVDLWSFNTTYTIRGDEAFYRPTINFSINDMTENYSEYTDYLFPIMIHD